MMIPRATLRGGRGSRAGKMIDNGYLSNYLGEVGCCMICWRWYIARCCARRGLVGGIVGLHRGLSPVLPPCPFIQVWNARRA